MVYTVLLPICTNNNMLDSLSTSVFVYVHQPTVCQSLCILALELRIQAIFTLA